ncbi:unnamed protein product, partial [Symbiodinium microadriaticum]
HCVPGALHRVRRLPEELGEGPQVSEGDDGRGGQVLGQQGRRSPERQVRAASRDE